MDNVDELYIEQKEYLYNGYDKVKKLNSPKLLTGMTPIKFVTPTEEHMGYAVETNENDAEWYSYGTTPETRKWANAKTEDGSMWVWLPRYAYKITYYTNASKAEESNEITQYGDIDVKFLIGKTDYYYDNNGEIQKAQRATTVNQAIDTTEDYTVHPAFTDESDINFYNGGWDEELTGIWVAKFEAGYASANNSAPVKASSVIYDNRNSNSVFTPAIENGTNSSNWATGRRNWLDGIYGTTENAIKYPTFQPLTYSMNYMSTSDAFNISRALTESGNIYGLSNEDTNSHLMKNSEWGAIAYLTHSKYGRNGNEISINNVSLNSGSRTRVETSGKSGVDSAYAVTGMTSNTTTAGEIIVRQEQIENVINGTSTTANGCYLWNQSNGTGASTTDTIYGVYDLSGGMYERTASFISNGNIALWKNGQALIDSANVTYTEDINLNSATVTANTGTSSKYTTIYSPYLDTVNSGSDNADNGKSQSNFRTFTENSNRYGDAIKETTIAKAGTVSNGWNTSSWNMDYSEFPEGGLPLFYRGGDWNYGYRAGTFSFSRMGGTPHYFIGFRTVLVAL